ncbi:hypothetical protein [uncultured Boseongicola sp.]|uniref:hypothetical protein n=1 Tax=uncultured Boseongicola sp. TaxID=1648499 RepID=UPI002630D0EB|nr:hypothetical protein [uncultured Boseongicola sp.]
MGRAHRDGGKLEADVHKGRTAVGVFGDEFAFTDVSEFERARANHKTVGWTNWQHKATVRVALKGLVGNTS